jgi:hypothetical protein
MEEGAWAKCDDSSQPLPGRFGIMLSSAFAMLELRQTTRLVRAAICAFLSSSSGILSGQVHFKMQTQEVVEERLRKFGGSDFEREAKLKKLFLDSGCSPDELKEETVKAKQPPNLMCVLPGTTDQTILVGAHFDHVDLGDGVVDNWSGASLLPSLLFTVRQEPRKHTYIFIGFMGEEHQLQGSEFYVKHLPEEQRARIKAMINMDTLGLGPTEVWASHADPNLLGVFAAMAKALQIPVRGMNADGVGTTDSESFAKFHIPRITIHSLTGETLPVLHSSRDRLDKIQMSEYYDTYRLTAGYLVYLDGYLDRDEAHPAAASSTTR